MSLITWSEKYSMGIATIDAQHKKLIDAINKLNAALKEGRGTEVISQIIIELISYTKEHFGTEEKYFEETGYSDTQLHKMEHELFVKKVAGFAAEYNEKKSLALVIEVSSFLWSWLADHILTKDVKYVPWLKEHGIK